MSRRTGRRNGQGALAPNTPSGILGAALLAWYRSDLGVTVIGSGVDTWADQSGTGDANKNARQTVDANRPPLTAIDASFNNFPSVNVLAGKFLQTGIWSVAMPGPTTIFVVGNNTSNGTDFFVNSLGNPLGVFTGTSNVKITDEGNILASGVSASNTPSVIVAVFDNASSSIAVRQNTPQNTGLAGTGAATGLTLGGFSDGTANLTGPLVEVIVANGHLSAGTIARICSGYLAPRYALTQGA